MSCIHLGHLIDTIDIHSLNNSERIALLRILVSYTVPKLAIENIIINNNIIRL